MSRADQDAQVQKQAKEQIEFNAGAEAWRCGKRRLSDQSVPWKKGWDHAELEANKK